MPTHQRFRLDNPHDLQDRRKPSIHLEEEPAIIVREPGSASSEISGRLDSAIHHRSHSSRAANVMLHGRTRTQSSIRFASHPFCILRSALPHSANSSSVIVEPALAVADSATNGSRSEIVRTCFVNMVRLHLCWKRVMCASNKEFRANRLAVTSSRLREAS